MYRLLIKIPIILNAPSNDDEGKFVGGWLGDKLESSTQWFGESFRKALVDFGKWLVNGLFDILSPFIIWGCKLVIVWCIVTFFCTGDKKCLTLGMKSFLIYLIFLMIRGVLL